MKFKPFRLRDPAAVLGLPALIRVCSESTVYPRYNGPRYTGYLAIPDALMVLSFRTSKIPPLYRTAHIMHLLPDRIMNLWENTPVLHTNLPRYTGYQSG